MPTNPGRHAAATLSGFDFLEKKIVDNLALHFYITGSDVISFGNATYKYVTMRPSHNIEHAIPQAREFLCLFSPYENFEARTLDAYYRIIERFEPYRINGHFRLLFSQDKEIGGRLTRIFSSEPDIPVTIPLNYEEGASGGLGSTLTRVVRQNYHFRDLFAQRDPLQENTFFFGRSNLLRGLRDRMARGEMSGVFGLRKSGKTSVLLAAERYARADGHRFALMDCQSASVTAAKWNEVLRQIAVILRTQAGLASTPAQLGDFSPLHAATAFEKTINDVFAVGKRVSVIGFDEIEHVSPGSGIPSWRDGENARFLWQTVRSVHQKTGRKFAVIVAGTNPSIVESRKLSGSDNPLLEYI